jgi:hypothetical protein
MQTTTQPPEPTTTLTPTEVAAVRVALETARDRYAKHKNDASFWTRQIAQLEAILEKMPVGTTITFTRP